MYFSLLSILIQIGGRVDGALGDARDRSGKGHDKLNRWLVRDCAAASRDQPKKNEQSVIECASDDDVSSKFFNY
jgi:hypothetical protein